MSDHLNTAKANYAYRSAFAIFGYTTSPMFLIYFWGWFLALVGCAYLIFDWNKLHFLYGRVKRNRFLNYWFYITLSFFYSIGLLAHYLGIQNFEFSEGVIVFVGFLLTCIFGLPLIFFAGYNKDNFN